MSRYNCGGVLVLLLLLSLVSSAELIRSFQVGHDAFYLLREGVVVRTLWDARRVYLGGVGKGVL